MLDTLAGIDLTRFLLAIGVVGLGLLGLIGVMWIIRNRPSSPFVKGGRTRQQRLAVVDAAAVDARRRILLVRRDNVEHLIMIGGPTDIVIESRISTSDEALATAPQDAGMQNALELPELALELPAPPLRVTTQQAAVPAQKQAASTIQPEKMTPAEPKHPVSPAEPLPSAEPLSFQPSPPKTVEQAAAAKPEPVRREPLRPVTVISPAVPVTSPAVSVLSPRLPVAEPRAPEPEPEIRNPYLESETARPAPAVADREPVTARKEPAAAPLAYKWPAPLEAAKSEPKPATVFPDLRETSELRDPMVKHSPLPPVIETPVFPSQPAAPAANPVPVPEAIASAPVQNQPVDLDSLMSSDFLDAARNRVLAPLEDARPAPAVQEPATSAAIEPPSEFAKILDEELKAEIPDARFETPRLDATLQRMEPSREPADLPGAGRYETSLTRREPTPPVTTGPSTTGPSLLRPMIFSEPTATDRNAQAAPSVAEPAKKSIADILDAARSRVLAPETAQPSADDMSFDDMILEPEDKQAPSANPSAVQDDFILEFEKIWESQLENHAPGAETNRPAATSAPAVEPEPSARPSVSPEGYNQNNRRDPFLSPLPDEKELAALEQELSLDDEMAKVLGEFSLTRKR